MNHKNVCGKIAFGGCLVFALSGCAQIMAFLDDDDDPGSRAGEQVVEGKSASAKAEEQDGKVELVETEGFLNEFHAAHAGQIVFYTEFPSRDDLSRLEPKTSFTLNDPIYMRSFLADSMGNKFRALGEVCRETSPNLATETHYYLQINDAPREDWQFLYYEVSDFEPFHVWTSNMIPESMTGLEGKPLQFGELEQRLEMRFKMQVLPTLEAGEYTMTVHSEAHCQTFSGFRGPVPVASGTFTLTIDEPSRQQAMFERGPVFPAPRHPEHAALQGPLFETVTSSRPEFLPLAVTTTGSGWSIENHQLTGEPVRRGVSALLKYKNTETDVCRVRSITITQHHAGGGNYESIARFIWGDAVDQVVPCPN